MKRSDYRHFISCPAGVCACVMILSSFNDYSIARSLARSAFVCSAIFGAFRRQRASERERVKRN